MNATPVTTWYLEMRDPAWLRPARVPEPAPLILRAEHPLPMLNRFLYTAVGGHWYWRDRLNWSYARWLAWLDRPALQTWVLYVRGTPAGYVELEKQAGDDVEIAYFGLMREFFGQGLGGHLLSVGIERAWAMGARRVWVHTCTLDGPHALANYEARGMRRYHEETRIVHLPAQPEGPWPGWDRSDDV
ncbi:Acetyltransferase (GNAT) domain-containing protein [Fontimonas thermophila]|uniref:Acetyltransferase (GNAT) domain-containing protein n=1 Tax=Fontimonas thermophila TaxID=1076937 RepID=A0A1I2JL71_9GAMM|nr:GNAT family N-acetyltransferase [Fontimonas thermophila]SFF55635.1 Acetyltransferase (GNAT) domain-containing protein [Fontimonas thermophila]